VSSPDLLHDGRDDIVDGEGALFRADLGVQDDLQHHVAEFI